MKAGCSMVVTFCLTFLASIQITQADGGNESSTPSTLQPAVAETWSGVLPMPEPGEMKEVIEDLDAGELVNTGGERGAPCGNTIFDNLAGANGIVHRITDPVVGNPFTYIYCGDDITMGGTDRFACEVTVRLGSTDITVTPSFVYNFEFWDVANINVCPDNGATMFFQSGPQLATGFPANNTSINFVTPIAATPVPNTFWLIIRTTAPTRNPYIRHASHPAGTAGTNPTQGFYVGQNNNLCDNGTTQLHFLTYAAPADGTVRSFAIKIVANAGPSGACCTQSGPGAPACVDNINLGACSAYNQRWTQGTCAEAPPCVLCDKNCTGATVLENEPVCAANYIDTRNNGCSFTQGTQSFIDISCGADVCGQFGTYTFLNGTVTENRRDNDYYRFTLTSTQRVTWTVNAESGANAIIFIPLGGTPCDDLRQPSGAGDTSSDTSNAGCDPAIATACLPPGTYYAVVRTPSTVGVPCGVDYRATLTCQSCSLPTGACCLPTGSCAIENEIDCLQDGGAYRGDGTSCATANCPPPPGNETCATKSSITANVTISFDTTFAVTESTANIAACTNLPIFKDIWYDYRIVAANQPAGASFGRIAVSTLDSCFDTRVLVYRVIDCGANQASQCTDAVALVCNDDINLNTGNLASFVVVSDNGEGVQPNVGECYKIRVGGATATDGGPGFMRVDFLPSGNSPWSDSSGRCCFANGGCQITPGPGNTGDCASLGGFFSNTTSFGEGDPAFSESNSVGCHTVPCPVAGEACFNAINLHSNPSGGILTSGFGTTTRAITNKLFYKYQIPVSAAVGSGISINTCGSSFNTAIAVYSSFDTASGECLNDSTLIAKNDNCSPNEASAAGAQGIAPCFANGEIDSCLCLTVGTIGQATGPGSTIYIEVGASNSITGSTLPSIDPVPANCGTAVDVSLTVTATAACFACNLTCPGGSVQEAEPVCAAEYVDTTNGGCNSTPAVFKSISCNQTICGEIGTYTFTNGTTQQNRRDTDWYRFSVTTTRTINVTINAGFRPVVSLQKVNNVADPCATNGRTTIASVTAAGACVSTNLSAAVCPGDYILIIVPDVFTGIDCGTDYVMSVNCAAPPAQVCCQGDMNNDGVVNGADVQLFIRALLVTPIAQFPIDGCYNLNTCRADFTGDYAITLADVGPFVTKLLSASSTCSSLPTCSDPARCHFTDQSGGSISDLNTGPGCNFRNADDFRPQTSGSIQSICWYGFYLNFTNGTACVPTGGSSADNFRITIYNDNNKVPGSVLGGPFGSLTVTKTDTGVDIPLSGFGDAREYRYSTTIPAVAVTANQCYWIEIVNGSTGACCWAWSFSGFTNDVSAGRNGGPAGSPTYVAGDVSTGDFAFCLNDIRIHKQDCGLPQGRCCTASLQCSVTDQFTCLNVTGGTWLLGGNCTGGCPAPGADACGSAVNLALNTPAQGSTVGLTVDGPSLGTCEGGCTTGCNTAPDAWYVFTPAASGPTTASLCSGTTYDSVLAVYSGACGTLTQMGCDDDGCGVTGGASTVSWTATAGTPYRIRITGFNGASGNYSVVVTQP